MRLCKFQNALGKPGNGFHKARVYGTNTALWDFIGTMFLAWLTSVAFGVRLSVTIIGWFAAAELMHWIFCVPVE